MIKTVSKLISPYYFFKIYPDLNLQNRSLILEHVSPWAERPK